MSTQAPTAVEKKPPAFPLYAQDFLTGIMFFPPDAVGGYIRLLCLQWTSGGIPDDDSVIAQVTGCQKNAVALIRTKFQRGEDGMLRNSRLEEIRTEKIRYREKQAENARNGWEKRAKKTEANAKPHAKPNAKPSAKGDAKPMPKACSSSSSSNNTPIVPKGDGGGDFESPPSEPWDEDAECLARIWEAYDGFQHGRDRSSKGKVAKEWEKIPKGERPEHDRLVDSLARWRKSEKWNKSGGQYVCTAHIWVKDRKWETIPVPAVASGNEAIGKGMTTEELNVI